MALSRPSSWWVRGEEPSILVVGVHPTEVRSVPPGPRFVNRFVRRRGRTWRQRSLVCGGAAGVLGFGGLLGGWLFHLGWLAAWLLALLLARLAWLAWQRGEMPEEVVRDGALVPIQACLVKRRKRLELLFSTNERHPSWHQVFRGPGARRWSLTYEVDGARFEVEDAVRPDDRIACIEVDGRLTPAALVDPNRPERSVLVTEATLAAV